MARDALGYHHMGGCWMICGSSGAFVVASFVLLGSAVAWVELFPPPRLTGFASEFSVLTSRALESPEFHPT